MSRRKQGRPQQRKTLDSLEQDKDLLVCGDCQTTFPLHDILTFIRHKVHRCNKENIDGLDDPEFDHDSTEPETLLACIASKQQSISAPITRKESLDTPSPLPSNQTATKDGNAPEEREDEVMEDEEDEEKVMDEKLKERDRVPLKPRVVDAETNTSLSEPTKVICDTCKAPFNSAWKLVQHAQKEHGIKIFTLPMRPDLSTPSPRLNLEQRTPPTSGHESPFTHPPHIFPQFRMPMDRPNSHGAISPFSRPPGLDFLDMNDPFQLRHRLGMHHSPFGPTSPFGGQRPLSLEDFYSKRLQQLASTTGSPPGPNQTPPRPSYSPSAAPRDPRDFREIRESRESRESRDSNPPPHIPVTSSTHEMSSESGSNMSPKLKSCEFCGKSFRFPSNLIVHRRSHTGEKPFKCPLCPHACTQQSKLKRHMKTHLNNKSPMSANSHGSNPSTCSDGSIPSTSSTPDNNSIIMSKLGEAGYNLDEEDDDEEEDEMEEEEEEEMEEEREENDVYGSYNDDTKYIKNGEAHDTELKKLENKSEYSNELNGDHERDVKTPRSRSDSGTPDKPSLLSEVMVQSGLNNISSYSDAFQQALKENSMHKEHQPEQPKENHDKEEKKDIKPRSSPTGSVESRSKENIKIEEHRSPNLLMPHHTNHLFGHPDKFNSVKREPNEPPHNSMDATIFSRYWYPAGPGGPLRDFYSSFSPPFGVNHDFRREPHLNGFGLAASQDSALKSVGLPKPGPSVSHSPSNGPSPISRKSLRNDTCEYCGKIFRNCSNLTVHRRSHTGEKPYKCELCNYACAQSSKLTRHKRTHGRMGKDVYRCKFCAMPFSVASTLEKHMRKCVDNRQARLLHEADTDTNSTTASNH